MTAAVILAAGRGSRLGKYTRHLPKALVRAGGRSLLGWHCHALRECGVSPVIVAGGYLSERIEHAQLELVDVPHWSETGPLASLRATQPARLGQDFLVVYADCPHHASNLRRLLTVTDDIAVVGDRAWRPLWQQRHAQPLDDAESYRGAGGLLQAIGARPSHLDEIDAQFAGLLRFTQEGWQCAERALTQSASPPTDMTGLLALLLGRGERIADVPIHGRWCEIDSADDLRLCRRRLRDATGWSHDWRDSADEPRWP
ncbi:MAG: NTP transferase domain-containing protein [Dokdonella sp.]